MSQHTPTPWEIYDTRKTHKKGRLFLTGQAQMLAEFPNLSESNANAEFIIRAVNSHDVLLNTLILALPYVETALEDQGYKPGVVDRMVRMIRDTIAQAEGKP